jgi:hypothetical protein
MNMKRSTTKLRVETLESRQLMAVVADLLVDSNRDGRIDASDNFQEEVWTSGSQGRGAIVLPNLDRDNTTTGAPDNWTGGNFNGNPVMPNNLIDNAEDLKDIGLVRLSKLDTDAPFNYRLTINLLKPESDPVWLRQTPAVDRVRIFMPSRVLSNGDTTVQANDVAVIGPGQSDSIVFTASPSKPNEYSINSIVGTGGFYLGIEGLKSGANVRVMATLQFAPPGTDGPPPPPRRINRDVVEIKVAPFVLQNNTQLVDRAIVEDLNKYGLDNSKLRQTMRSVFGDGLVEADSGDLWQQDGYEVGYVQAPYGSMTVILDLPRGRDVYFNDPKSMRSFIRSNLLAPGVGINIELADKPVESNSSFGGDIDSVIKPGSALGDPGYLLMSNMPSYMKDFFEAQGVNKSIDLPLEWLGVNHVDEVIQQSSDGKHILIADPDLAWALLMLAAKIDPTVRLHPNMNGNESLVGYNRQGILASTYLQSEKLRWQNLIYTQRNSNLSGVARIMKETLGLTDEVNRPLAAVSNTGDGQLRKAGVMTQFLNDGAREYRIRFVDANQYRLQYRDGEAWSTAGTGSRLRDEVFQQAGAFVFSHYWTGNTRAGDVFSFRTNPDATLVKMPVMFASPFVFLDATSTSTSPSGPLRVSPFSVNHINSLVAGTTVITGQAFGPRVDFDGLGKRDLFQDYARRVFQSVGYRAIRFTDSTLYHNAGGSIHCGTNAIRKRPSSLWWSVQVDAALVS